MNYCLDRADEFIGTVSVKQVIRYLDYWKPLTPMTNQEYYWCWIFAFMSVHASWEKNVEAFLDYKRLKPREEINPGFSIKRLKNTIIESRIGLDRMRTQGIWEFHHKFWSNPDWWWPNTNESMVACRDRLAKASYGLGLAKTAFMLELAFPSKCDVVCLDTHILQLYDYNKRATPGKKAYHAMERHWIDSCAKRDMPSPIVRHIYWDAVQQKQNSRYWSYVLEKEKAA